jgi:hypothetical protein
MEFAIIESPALGRLIARIAKDASVLTALRLADLPSRDDDTVSRAEVAMALNALLFADLLTRVPTARAYVDSVVAKGERVHFDHGALRTIDGPTGALPSGFTAFARLLGPLGYAVADLYPLPRLKMTGRAFVQRDFPEDIPQFFVSELHVEELPEPAQAAVARVFGASSDPIGSPEQALLDALAAHGRCPFDLAAAGLPGLMAAFGRHHPEPMLEDYEGLLPHSAEAAWIATEGNAFNHATDRVADITGLIEDLKAQGQPLKPEIEVSANGRIRQTAFLADKVIRGFRLADGGRIERAVPGSFYEFIQREIDPATGKLDLGFDSGNATGIFAVTKAT